MSNVEVTNYISKMKNFEQQLRSAQTTVKSTMAGTVVYKLDGYEEVLTLAKVSSYTPEMLNSFNIPKGELVGTSKENCIKIVDNLECYITVVLDEEFAKDIYVDQKVQIGFPEINSHLETSAVIDYITYTPDGTVVTFKINRAIEDTINYRKTKIKIIWDSEDGYKVPANAIIKEEEGDKVYIYLSRNYIAEKKVTVIKEFDGQAIIEGRDGDKLYLYDSIVLNASSVNKNKLLKH